jgi:glycerophosphoryl diester phosphodiesterase
VPNLPLLLGHRGAGARRSVPENTEASFDAALRYGCDGFEFDVRLNGLGQAIICHDSKVDGMKVAESREELFFLPRLREVLARYGARAFLDIELKVPGVESELLLALAEHIPQHGFVVSSFFPNILQDLRARCSNLPLGYICDEAATLDQWRDLPIQFVIPHYSLSTRAFIDEVHSAGRSCLVWTVNDRNSMLRFAEWGVDGIISDEVELMVSTFRKSDRSRPGTKNAAQV